MNYSRLVQLVEHRTVNPYVSGSNPESGAKFKAQVVNLLGLFCFLGFIHTLDGTLKPLWYTCVYMFKVYL